MTDAALQAAVQAAVAGMEAARPGAQGQGNVLNNRLQQTPNANAKPFFDKGWRDWAAGEAALRPPLPPAPALRPCSD